MLNLNDIFDAHDDDFLTFERVESKRSQRPDLHAFLLLDSIVPGTSDIVCASEHDEIFLGVSLEDLAENATEEQIVELIRCGVRIDDRTDSLAMFT